VERFGKISGMIETAENLARDYGSRASRPTPLPAQPPAAAAAWAAGRFADEIVPVQVPQRKGDPILFSQDEVSAPTPRLRAWPSCAC
jgi:acetyl-CoA C-acetyltransferase